LHTYLETKFYPYLKFSSLARSLTSVTASKSIDWKQHGPEKYEKLNSLFSVRSVEGMRIALEQDKGEGIPASNM